MAERHLWHRGHRILERNWTSSRGEIDLISALPDGTIVFTEVKTRRGVEHGDPLEAVTEQKSEQVMRVAQDYLRMWQMEDRPVRFDAIGVLVDESDGVSLEHIEGIG
jgi:putative endonuclease